jgi:hypothetical protein
MKTGTARRDFYLLPFRVMDGHEESLIEANLLIFFKKNVGEKYGLHYDRYNTRSFTYFLGSMRYSPCCLVYDIPKDNICTTSK